MFFQRDRKPAPLTGSTQLQQLVQAHMPQADPETWQLVGAVAGLLAGVAYADRDYSAPEQLRVRQALEAVEGIAPGGVDAICALLRDRIVDIAAINPQAYTRALRELADLGLRREILELLVELAAADGELALSETDLLRRTTAALGLTQDDYVLAQSRHRDKLKTLR